MDEPFGAGRADAPAAWGKVLQIQQELMQTTLLITHSITEAVQLSDRVVIMTYRPGKAKRIIDINLPRRGLLKSSEAMPSAAMSLPSGTICAMKQAVE
jgi:NitT/TauT family transport system ATP-binding protein